MNILVKNMKKKIVDTLKKQNKTFVERNLPEGSYFEVEFKDGSKAHEKDYNWSDISEEVLVNKMGEPKVVRLCKYPVKSISITHAGQTVKIDVPDGCRAYQAIVAESTFVSGRGVFDRTVGRIVGIVNDKNEVIEERSINSFTSEIFGFKK